MMNKTITANSLWDFLLAVKEGIKEGYDLSDDVDKFPQQLAPGLYTVTMVKEVVKPEPGVVKQVRKVKTQ